VFFNMGHKPLETTKGYLHADSLSVRSPLEIPPGPTSGGRRVRQFGPTPVLADGALRECFTHGARLRYP
jgi:hypothetical protein